MLLMLLFPEFIMLFMLPTGGDIGPKLDDGAWPNDVAELVAECPRRVVVVGETRTTSCFHLRVVGLERKMRLDS